MKNLLPSMVLFLICPLLSPAPAGKARKTESVSWRVDSIRSAILKEEVELRIFLPADYGASAARYPVLYITNISWPPAFPHALSIVRLLGAAGWMPKSILVGVGCNRERDLAPTSMPGSGTDSGHADRFLDFFEKELVPRIEKSYRTSGPRIFWGHSISGTLGLYALMRRPTLFQSVLATSPWFIYDIDDRRREKFGDRLFAEEKGYLLKHAAGWLGNRTGQQNFLYLAIGDEPQLLPYFDGFVNILETQKPHGLIWKIKKWQGQSHQTMALYGLTAGLVALYPQK